MSEQSTTSQLGLLSTHWLGQLRRRLRGRADSEHEQALMRPVIAVVITLYSIIAGLYSRDHLPHDAMNVAFVGLVYCGAALALIGAIIAFPAVNVMRRGFGIVLDTCMTSYFLAVLGDMGAPLFAAYMWIILGNGFRYGMRYLVLSTALVILSFAGVAVVTPVWSSHPTLAIGLMLVIGIIPMYTGAVVRKLHSTLNRTEDAVKWKNQFIASISTAFRAPLNGVTAMTSLLLQAPLNPGQKEMAETVAESGRILSDLLNNAMDLGQIESGELKIANIEFDIHVLLNSLMAMFMPLANARGLEFRVNIAPDAPRLLLGDPHHIRQVLVNLISNAIKFTNTGYIDLTVSVSHLATKHALFRFEVKDTGIGISDEARDRILNRVRRGHDAPSRVYGGAGLGLMVSKQLVELLGGKLEFVSHPGNGSIFWFELEMSVSPSAGAHPDASTGLSACRCLVISSFPSLLDTIEALLHRWSVPYAVVDNSAAALTLLRESADAGIPHRVVMVDASSPQVHAMALADAIRSEPTLFGIVLTVFQPHGDPHSTNEYLAAGYTTVMNAPPDTRHLFNMLHAVVSLGSEEIRGAVTVMPASVAQNRPSLRILVAEDNPVNQDVTRRILVADGHQVTVVGDGQAALEGLRTGQYDLVIADLRMPNMGGLEAMRTYFQSATTHRVPWLVLTADVTRETMRECANSGADGYLTKPVNPMLLLARVHQVTEAAPKTGFSEHDAHAPDDELIELKEILAGGQSARSLLEQRLCQFEENAMTCIERMQNGLLRNDLTSVRLASITFESYCTELGAKRLSQSLSRIYTMTGSELSQRGGDEVRNIIPLYEQTVSVLHTLLSETPPAADT